MSQSIQNSFLSRPTPIWLTPAGGIGLTAIAPQQGKGGGEGKRVQAIPASPNAAMVTEDAERNC